MNSLSGHRCGNTRNCLGRQCLNRTATKPRNRVFRTWRCKMGYPRSARSEWENCAGTRSLADSAGSPSAFCRPAQPEERLFPPYPANPIDRSGKIFYLAVIAGAVAKWLRQRFAKPPFVGSTPTGASSFLRSRHNPPLARRISPSLESARRYGRRLPLVLRRFLPLGSHRTARHDSQLLDPFCRCTAPRGALPRQSVPRRPSRSPPSFQPLW